MILDLQGIILRNQTLNVAYKEQVIRLEQQNSSLFDRLAARSLPELKTFTIPEETHLQPEEYNPLEDEDLAGEITDVS